MSSEFTLKVAATVSFSSVFSGVELQINALIVTLRMRFFHSNTEIIIQNVTAHYACRDVMVAATTNEFSFHGLIRVNITYSRLKKSLNIFIFYAVSVPYLNVVKNVFSFII